MSLRRQIALSTMAAALVGVLAAGVVALGLVRTADDGQARRVLHREAVLIANLEAAQRGALAARLVAPLGVKIVRVRPDGTVVGRQAGDPSDVAAAAAGRQRATSRTVNGVRHLVEVQPVDGGGGVVLLQPLSQARAVTGGVLGKLALALAIGLGTAAAIGIALARRLARPLVDAAAAAHQLSDGNRSVRLADDGPVELAELSRSLNALAQALAASEAREREFLLSVSHELRTPLTGIRGYAEAIGDGLLDPVQACLTIQGEAERMQRLVTDLLDLARAGADDFRLELAPVDLTALVRDAAVIWQRRCSEVGVVLRVELPGSPVLVTTDAGRIRQVLDGLAENALRVVPSGQPIVFCVAAPAVLQVRDGGPGLSPADLPVAFERSVLYDRYRGVRQVGTGLGLALVGTLVSRLGGAAHAGHAPEGGASFTVRLPH